MAIKRMARRAFFVGKVSKYVVSVAFLVMAIFPTAIKADTSVPLVSVDNQLAMNASSIIATTGIQSTQSVYLTPVAAKLVWVTAYASVPDETDSTPFITADGEHVRDGIIAANWLPFGAQVEIPSLFGDKIFTVEDRMNTVFNQRADIWMPTVNDALDFGIHQVMVVVVSQPNLSS